MEVSHLDAIPLALRPGPTGLPSRGDIFFFSWRAERMGKAWLSQWAASDAAVSDSLERSLHLCGATSLGAPLQRWTPATDAPAGPASTHTDTRPCCSRSGPPDDLDMPGLIATSTFETRLIGV